jgi:predicted nuclease with TOPRIM domain
MEAELNEILNQALQCFKSVQRRIEAIETRLADLEFTLDELPEVSNIVAAVKELQDEHEAPAMKFTHYILGVKR